MLEIPGIFHGDCRNLLTQLEPSSVRLALSDLPYNVAKKNNFHTMGRGSIDFEWDKEPLAFDQWLPLLDAAVKPSGSLVFFYDVWKLEGLKAYLEEELDYVVKRPMIYLKKNPWPRNKERAVIQAFEMGLWAVKKPSKGSKWVFNRRPEVGYETLVFDFEEDEDTPLVFKAGVPRMPKGTPRHKALKPLAMFRDLIRIFSDPGDLVVDPFAGQGTMAVSAELEGRRHVSFEKDAYWHAEAVKRLELQRGK